MPELDSPDARGRSLGLLVLLMALLFPAPAVRAQKEAGRVGFVDVMAVFEAYDKRRDEEKDLQRLQKKLKRRTEELTSRITRLEKGVEELEENSPERREKERELESLRTRHRILKREARKELGRRHEAKVQALIAEIEDRARALAKSEGLDLLLSTADDAEAKTREQDPVNLTARLIERLNGRYRKEVLFPRVDRQIEAIRSRLAGLRKRLEAADTTEAESVGKRLALMVRADQLVRRAWMVGSKLYDGPVLERYEKKARSLVTSVDAANRSRLKQILKAHGWPTIGRFGREADQNAWLIAQHADGDRPFQKQILNRLEELVATGDTNATNFAYLYDRVAVAEDRPQRYGTQGTCTEKGTWEPGPLEEPEAVDEHREEVGLPPFDAYRRRMNQICEEQQN